jgi:hypothetical protein
LKNDFLFILYSFINFIKLNFLAKYQMVYYFTSNVVDPPAVLFMGDDKEENELLIRYEYFFKWG